VKYTIQSYFTFFPNRPGSHIAQPICTQNGLNDVYSRIDVPFAVEMKTFQVHGPQPPKFGILGRDLLALGLAVSEVNSTPSFFTGAP